MVWGDEMDTKLYALETILRLIQFVGPKSIEDPGLIGIQMDEFVISDPFFKSGRELRLVGNESFGANRQIATPIMISEFFDGNAEVVILSEIPDLLER